MALPESRDYVEDFDPEWYLAAYGSGLGDTAAEKEANIGNFFIETYHEFFCKDIEWGDTLLDIGTGPTIQSILSASRRLGYIDLGDFSPKVLQILRDWHGGSKQIQQEHLKYEMSLVSDKTAPSERENAIREKVKNIHRVDINTKKVFIDQSDSEKVYDVITSSLCFDAACATMEEYKTAILNISNLLKDGGHIIISGVLDCSYYRCGDFRFHSFNISATEVRNTWEESGFTILEWKTLFEEPPTHPEETDFSDFQDAFCMLARKRI